MSKRRRTKEEWRNIALHCETAYLMAPKWSPMRLFFKWGIWYAERKARSTTE